MPERPDADRAGAAAGGLPASTDPLDALLDAAQRATNNPALRRWFRRLAQEEKPQPGAGE
jgi:hypothetical protein